MFDPGVSTGIVYWVWDEKHHAEPRGIWQIDQGTVGLDIWIDGHWDLIRSVQYIGSEKYVPRSIDGMTHTLESTYPLVQEGLLIGRQVMPHYPNGHWQPAANQYPVGGDTPEERKRRMDDLLKRAGLWLTGEDVDAPDANDALSATRHMIYLLTRTIRHQPTIEWFYGEGEA
jgi:hypothetical protein